MVQRLHEAGIEVILDVVYNHTAEGNQLGPTLSFRGLDNASYYVLADDPRYYFDTTGCGNNVNLRHPRVVQMVMDSLRYWVEDCHVDGFRFDLAVTLTRDRERGRLQQPVPRRGDPGPGARQGEDDLRELGPRRVRLPGRARSRRAGRSGTGASATMIRAYVKGDAGDDRRLRRATCSARATSSTGAGGGPGRASTSSPPTTASRSPTSTPTTTSTTRRTARTTATAHDDNRSWNCGVEGPTDDEAMLDLRDRMRRFAITALIVSQGVPMILMGDENGRTPERQQQRLLPGQRSSPGWTGAPSRARRRCFDFVAGRARGSARELPLLAAPHWLRGDPVAEGGLPGVRWLRPDGVPMTEAEWTNGQIQALAVALRQRRAATAALLLVNASDGGRAFVLPETGSERPWRLRLDSGAGAIDADDAPHAAGEEVTVPGRCLLVYSLWSPGAPDGKVAADGPAGGEDD